MNMPQEHVVHKAQQELWAKAHLWNVYGNMMVVASQRGKRRLVGYGLLFVSFETISVAI